MTQSPPGLQKVTIEVDIIVETDKAWLVATAKKKRSWIPKSQAVLHENGLLQELEMFEFLAHEKGLL